MGSRTHDQGDLDRSTFFLERFMPSYRAEFAEFVTAIEEDRAPAVGFADGRAALVLAEAANESVATGKAVLVTGG